MGISPPGGATTNCCKIWCEMVHRQAMAAPTGIPRAEGRGQTKMVQDGNGAKSGSIGSIMVEAKQPSLPYVEPSNECIGWDCRTVGAHHFSGEIDALWCAGVFVGWVYSPTFL